MVPDLDSTAGALAYGRDLLVGERVRLRALEEDDLPLLDRWFNDPEWQQLQSSTVKPRPEGAMTDTMRRWNANAEPGGVGFSIVETDSGALLGGATLWGAAVPERSATFAIQLSPESVGRGYGSDATRVVLRYGFLAMGLNRIELTVWAYNDRAIRAYTRAGFVEEGRRRQAVFANGAFHDQVIMAVLAGEWSQ